MNRIAIATHHKTGTTYARKVFSEIALAFNLPTVVVPRGGTFESFSVDSGIVFFTHATATQISGLDQSYKIIHFIRNPIALVVSAMKYHLNSAESWLHTKKLGKSYQDRLLDLPTDEDRILFEMKNSSRRNIDDMIAVCELDNVFNIKLEDISWDESLGDVYGMLVHCGFRGKPLLQSLEIAASQTLWYLDELPAHSRTGVSNHSIKAFTGQLLNEFNRIFPALPEPLIYPLSKVS